MSANAAHKQVAEPGPVAGQTEAFSSQTFPMIQTRPSMTSDGKRLNQVAHEDAVLLINCMRMASSQSASPPGYDGSDSYNSPELPPPVEVSCTSANTTTTHFGEHDGDAMPQGVTNDYNNIQTPYLEAAGKIEGVSGLSVAQETSEGSGFSSFTARAQFREPQVEGKVNGVVEPAPPKPAGVSEEQWSKKVAKMKGNRLAAKRCRERKKQYVQYLENRINYLEKSNKELQILVQGFRAAGIHVPEPAW